MTPMPSFLTWWMWVTTSGTSPTAGAVGDLSVHAGAVVVAADHGDLEPLVAGDLAEGGQAVDGGSAGDDDFLLLRFLDAVGPAEGIAGPGGRVLPVEEHDVEVFGLGELATAR